MAIAAHRLNGSFEVMMVWRDQHEVGRDQCQRRDATLEDEFEIVVVGMVDVVPPNVFGLHEHCVGIVECSVAGASPEMAADAVEGGHRDLQACGERHPGFQREPVLEPDQVDREESEPDQHDRDRQMPPLHQSESRDEHHDKPEADASHGTGGKEYQQKQAQADEREPPATPVEQAEHQKRGEDQEERRKSGSD